jgi:hypothetical protein
MYVYKRAPNVCWICILWFSLNSTSDHRMDVTALETNTFHYPFVLRYVCLRHTGLGIQTTLDCCQHIGHECVFLKHNDMMSAFEQKPSLSCTYFMRSARATNLHRSRRCPPVASWMNLMSYKNLQSPSPSLSSPLQARHRHHQHPRG